MESTPTPQRHGESALHQTADHYWYSRPVFFVADLARALHFYEQSLGFTKKWHEADGAGTVCQVDRSDCEIILCEDSARTSPARLFIELKPEGLTALTFELEAHAVPYTIVRWGYDVVRVLDPDGNELLFPIDSTLDGRETA
jgi:catechol 2,3-dioxygenase-like lactoylglutathione lyase family enzyme